MRRATWGVALGCLFLLALAGPLFAEPRLEQVAGPTDQPRAALTTPLPFPAGLTLLDEGTLGIAVSGHHYIAALDLATGEIRTLIGHPGLPPNVEDQPLLAPVDQAAFWFPAGILLDAEGGLLLTERGAHRLRRMRPDRRIETLMGTGDSGISWDDHPPTGQQLSSPQGIALGQGGAIYIADTDNHRLLALKPRRGRPAGLSDLTPRLRLSAEAPLRFPRALAIDGGQLYIGDRGHVELDDPQLTVTGALPLDSGGRILSWDGAHGRGAEVRAQGGALREPSALAADAEHLFVLDALASKVFMAPRRNEGPLELTVLAGTGAQAYGGDGGAAAAASFQLPGGLLHLNGQLYISDTYNHRLRCLDLATGRIATVAGTGQALPSSPRGQDLRWTVQDLAYADDRLIICCGNRAHGDSASYPFGRRVLFWRPTDDTVETLHWPLGGEGPMGRPGILPTVPFIDEPVSARPLPGGGLVVGDDGLDRLWLLTPGRPARAYGEDQLGGFDWRLAVGPDGRMLSLGWSDELGGAVIYEFRPEDPQPGRPLISDVGPYTRLRFQDQRRVLLCSYSAHEVIQLDLQTRQRERICGARGEGHSGDGGPATEATLRNPGDAIALADGSILIADSGNACLRRVDAQGRIETLRGAGLERLIKPTCLAAAPDGAIYVADEATARIYRLRLR